MAYELSWTFIEQCHARIESGQGEERHDKTDFWASSGSESAIFALDDDVARRVASSQVYIVMRDKLESLYLIVVQIAILNHLTKIGLEWPDSAKFSRNIQRSLFMAWTFTMNVHRLWTETKLSWHEIHGFQPAFMTNESSYESSWKFIHKWKSPKIGVLPIFREFFAEFGHSSPILVRWLRMAICTRTIR